jgi:hypothetical protein
MRPCLGLSGITEQVHDDGTLGDSLVDLEQVLSFDPSVLLGLLPRLSVLSYTNDDVHAVVAEVKALSVTLRSVTDERESVILEVFLEYSLVLVLSSVFPA